jgi:Ner family transcriptional regulator
LKTLKKSIIFQKKRLKKVRTRSKHPNWVLTCFPIGKYPYVLQLNLYWQNMTTSTVKKTSREDWHPEDIKAALHKRGTTLSRIALDAGLTSSSSLSACLVRPMPANEKRIADALGVPAASIWPSRYEQDGSPKLRGIRAISCTAEMRQNAAASKKTRASVHQSLAAA